MNYGSLTFKNVTINALDIDGGGCIRNKQGGKITVDGGTFNVNVDYEYNNQCQVTCVRNDGGEIIINDGTFYSNCFGYTVSNASGTMTINDRTFKGARGVISANGGKITINGGTCVQLNNLGSSYVLYTDGDGTVEVNKGTLIGYIMQSNVSG